MRAAVVYGFAVAAILEFSSRVAPQPVRSIVLWTFIAFQLGAAAVVCWRRTGLPFATGAMATGSAASTYLAAIAALGWVYPELPLRLWLPFGLGVMLGGTLLLAESRANADKWRQWHVHMEATSLSDILVFRHIPRLRGGATE